MLSKDHVFKRLCFLKPVFIAGFSFMHAIKLKFVFKQNLSLVVQNCFFDESGIGDA